MNLDDESQISAFFDDELDPGDHLAVAWSIESSPPLAQQLTDFKTTRSLIGQLDRPSIPEDISGTILAVITSQTKTPHRLVTKRVVRIAAAMVGVGGMAASLLLALTLLHRSFHDDFSLKLADSSAPSIARTDTHHKSLVPEEALTVRTAAPNRPLAIDSATSAPQTPPTKLAKAKSSGVDGPEPARPGQVDAMLGHRKVLRALIVADVLDQTSDRVRSFIEGDADREPEFGRITLMQGIVVDPDRPGEAEVYSVVMNDPGCGPFLDRLRRAFPSMELENEPEPSLVTQLTEVGQVAVFSGVRPAKLGSPPEEISGLVAAKAVASSDHFPPPTVVPLDPSAARTADFALGPPIAVSPVGGVELSRTVTRMTPHSSPPPGEGRAGSSSTQPDQEPVTVLVWVTRSPKR